MLTRPFTLLVSSTDSSDLYTQLKAVPGLEVDMKDCNIHSHPYDHVHHSDFPELTIITVVAIRVLPSIVNAVRDILIAYLQNKRKLFIIRKPDGSEVYYVGGISDPKQIEELENEISKCLLPND